MNFCFVSASHREEVLKKYLLRSVIFKKIPLIVMDGYINVSKAYNVATRENKADIYIYIHHDVYLPQTFEVELNKAITELNITDSSWGVLGVAGMVPDLTQNKKYGFGNLLDRGLEWGKIVKCGDKFPFQVQTLDELILITKGDFIFDENLPNHFYGADICMQAIKQGRKNYAINTYVHHNSELKHGERPSNFFDSEKYFREKYKDMLPIATTCAFIK
jgi:hypothetical protein